MKWLKDIFGRVKNQIGTTPRRTASYSPHPSFDRSSQGINEPTIESLPLTYTGLLDDVMFKYATEEMTSSFFNRMIAKNIFFSGGILFNDGYLVNHPVARKHLMKDGSLLREMISHNFIRILTRASDSETLSTMPNRMAESKNASFEQLIISPDWVRLRPIWTSLAAEAFRTSNARPWPAIDMSVGYTKLMKRVFEKRNRPSELGLRNASVDTVSRLEEHFLKSRPDEGNPRHKLEVSAKEVVQQFGNNSPDLLRQIMEIANQCYHYNFGMCLTEEFSEDVAVDTTTGFAFNEMLALDVVEQGQIDDLPILTVPDRINFDDGSAFAPFLNHSSVVGRAKVSYLTRLNLLLATNASDLRNLRKDVEDATEEYQRRIYEHFAMRYGRSGADRMFGASIAFGVGMLHPRRSGTVAVVGAPTAGLAVALMKVAQRSTREFLLRRFEVVDRSQAYDPTNDQLLRLGDIRPQLASLAFDKEKAREHLSDLPKFR